MMKMFLQGDTEQQWELAAHIMAGLNRNGWDVTVRRQSASKFISRMPHARAIGTLEIFLEDEHG